MNSIFTRRQLLTLAVTSTAAILATIPVLADPDERTPVKKKKKNTTKKLRRKLTRDDRIELNKLEEERATCRADSVYGRVETKDNAQDQAKINKKIEAETNRQRKLTKTLKVEKEADRKLRVELRRGKNKTGARHTLKEKDDLVRQINKNTGALKKRENEVKQSKETLKDHRKQQKAIRQQSRNLKNIISKSDSRCDAIDKEVQKIMFE